jgi:hypothetical protein
LFKRFAIPTTVTLVVTLQAAAMAQTASLDLLRRAIDPNPTLQSYTASAQLSATLHVVIPDHKNFSGQVYYLRPKRKIVFQNVSGALSRFKDLASTTPTYDEATAEYTITPLTDNGGASTYSMIPKKQGSRVKSVTLSVGTFRLPDKADISARFPGYSVDGTITFSNYKPNATVAPSVFASP